MPDNRNLATAKREKNTEFYTRWQDIEQEINAYLEYDKDVFKNKVILCPADDPFESNFFKFFATHFNDFKLKKLISTSYDPSPVVNTQLQLSLFDESNNDSEKTQKISKAYKIELSDVSDFDHNGRVNINDVEATLINERHKITHGNKSKILSYLDGDNKYGAGDFRSHEVTKLRDEADMIITNPPFALFREFMRWCEPRKRKVLLIGNLNGITYKEIFPMIKENALWLGATNFNTGMYFYVPDDFEYKKSYHFLKEMDGRKVNRVPSVCWFTNIDHGRRHQPLQLMSMADNLKFSKHKIIRGHQYYKYSNYDGIDVPYTDSIPSDYDGVMGVPVTFLNHYDPSQFEIIGCADYTGKYGSDDIGIDRIGEKWVTDYRKAGGRGHYTANMTSLVYYEDEGKACNTYKRVLIRKK